MPDYQDSAPLGWRGPTAWSGYVAKAFSIERVPHGSHGFAVYENPIEQLATAMPFIRGGLAHGDRCFSVYEAAPLKDVKRALRDGGINVTREEQRGAIVFLTPRQWVPQGLSPDGALDLIAARVEEAVAAGFAGVHAAIAKTWLASEGFGASWEREYELVAISRLHLLALSILCLFNPRGLPPDMLLDIYRLHPWIAIEGAVQPNLFYEPPEHLLDPPSAQARADWMHDQLLRLHESNQALRRHAGEFRALVETAPDSILHFDHDLRLIYVNPAGERLRGRPASQLIGKTTQEAGLAAAQVPGRDLALRQVFRTGRELMVEVPGRLPSGEEGMYQARLTPMLGADGTVTSVISIARDVSDRTRADHERGRLYQELMEREGRLREMVEQILLRQTADRRRVEGSLELQQLTSRELEILHFLAQGRTNQQIGLEMGLASGTVRNHVSRLLAKLGAVSRTQAAILAVEWGLST